MKHLLLFSIGPVQSFISQARKTHDLYAGSLLLSDLIKSAINFVGKDNLIFPSFGEGMPNRFLSWVPEEVTDCQNFGEKVQEIVKNEWKKIAKDCTKDLNIIPPGFNEQINLHLEVFWVIGKYSGNYAETVFGLEKELAAIKNLRPFQQFNWQNEYGITGERGRKCNLDGQRNVQFYRRAAGKQFNEEYAPLYSTPKGVSIEQNLSAATLAPGEGLSAVSFIKRRYKYKQTSNFYSTAEIALMEVLKILDRKNPDVRTGINLIREVNPQLYYEENVKEGILEKYLLESEVANDAAQSLRGFSNEIRHAANSAGLTMSKYYAVLTFDGDNMGKWLAGENLKDITQLQEFQDLFARCLGEFAKEARELLNNGKGQTVYAGGDDFLGFVNINHLLPTMRDLRKLFRDKVDTPLQHLKSSEISFSAGISVVHYKEPLTIALQEAQKAQALAKNIDGKNAFALSVIKGSGESHYAVFPFGDNEINVTTVKLLADALLHEDFSNSFIKNLRSEFERLSDFKDDPKTFISVFECELRRFLNRAANKRIRREDGLEKSKVLAEFLSKLIEIRKTENFFQMMHIVDLLQREMNNVQN